MLEEDAYETNRIREAAERAEACPQRQSQAAPSRAISTPPGPLLIEAPKSHSFDRPNPYANRVTFEEAFGVPYRLELSWDENVSLWLKRQAEEAARQEQQLQKQQGSLDVLFRKQCEKLPAQPTQAPQPTFDPYQPDTGQLLQSVSLGAPAPKVWQ